MYLFSLVFILLTVFGLFAEIVALQNNRFAAMKTGGAQQMLTWHTAAVMAARYSVGGAEIFANWGPAAGGGPCTIQTDTSPPPPTPLPGTIRCRDYRDLPAPPFQAYLDALNVSATQTINLLPVNYDKANLHFDTIILTDASGTNTRLAVTFIGPAAAVNGSLNVPVAPVGMTTTQLYRQLLRMNVDKFGFGYVINNQLQPASELSDTYGTNNSGSTASGSYTLPPAVVFDATTNPTGPIRSGALALFTPL